MGRWGAFWPAMMAELRQRSSRIGASGGSPYVVAGWNETENRLLDCGLVLFGLEMRQNHT
jgi:hypothetical protein